MKFHGKWCIESIEDYRKDINRIVGDLMPKGKRVDVRLVVLGFFLVVSGISPVLLTLANSISLNSPMTPASAMISFFCFIVSFLGYMIMHRSTEREWL